MSESRTHDDLEEYHFTEGGLDEPEGQGEPAHEPIIERASEEGIGAKIVKFLKDYGLYGMFALLIIVPAVLNLKDTLFGPSKPKPAERQSLAFTQTVPPPEQAAAPAPAPASNAGMIQRPIDAAPDKEAAIRDLLPPAAKKPQPASKTTVPVLSDAGTVAVEPAEKVAQRLDALEKSLAATSSQIKELVNEEVVAVNAAQFKALNNRISTMGSTITELSRQLYTQQQIMVQIQQGLLARQAAAKKEKVKRVESEVTPIAEDSERPVHKGKLMLDAAIPGRAWLLGADGETSTVTEGDEIPGYGRVTKIDPAAGVVVTSSGKLIRAVDS